MSRDRQSKLQSRYEADSNQLRIWLSKRSTKEAIGLLIVPDVMLGISPRGRVIDWQISNPQEHLGSYLKDNPPFAFKPNFQLKAELDQQQVRALLGFPNDTAAFISRWVIRSTNQSDERR